MGISGTVDFMSPEMAGRHAMPGGVAEEDEIDNMQAFLVHGSQIFPELSNEARQVMRAWLEFRNLFLPNVGSHHQEGQEQHNYLYYKVTLKHYNQMVPLLKQLEQEIMQPNSDHNPAISTRWTAFMTAWRKLAPKLAQRLNQAMTDHPNPYQAEPIQMTQDVV